MKFYYRLQFLSLKRSLEEAGLPIAAALVIFVLGYAGLFYAAKQLPTAVTLVLLFVQYSLLLNVNDQDRRDFMKQLFPTKPYAKILFLENTLITLPLVLIAVYSSTWSVVLGLLILPLLYHRLSAFSILGTSTPTPFARKPFEFIILFRRWWVVLVILHVLLWIALYVGNENLALILLFVQIILSLQAYDVVEDELLVWNYALTPQAFLWHKLKRGIVQCLLLSLPMISLFLIAYFGNIQIMRLIVLVVLVGMLLLWLSILMKYSSYPRRPGLGEIVVTISAVVTMILIPYLYYFFYKKSIKHLEKLL